MSQISASGGLGLSGPLSKVPPTAYDLRIVARQASRTVVYVAKIFRCVQFFQSIRLA